MLRPRSLELAAINGILCFSVLITTTQTVPLSKTGLEADDDFNVMTDAISNADEVALQRAQATWGALDIMNKNDAQQAQETIARVRDWNSSSTHAPSCKNLHRKKRWLLPALTAASLGFSVYQEIAGSSKRASQDGAISQGFEKTFSSLDRNYGAIVNVRESIDQMMMYNQQSFNAIDQKLDRYSMETISAVNGIGTKIDHRVDDILRSMSAMDEMNNKRTTLTLTALDTINSQSEKRKDSIIDAISNADKIALQRAQTTWGALDIMDKNNAQRAQETMQTIISADRNNFNRTVALAEDIGNVYRRVEDSANATEEWLKALEGRNRLRTSTIINATIIADNNNQLRFNETRDMMNELDIKDQNREMATWVALQMGEDNNELRTNKTIAAINYADMHNYNRTLKLLEVLRTNDERVNQTARETMETLNKMNRNNRFWTTANLDATIIADQNNDKRFNQINGSIIDLDQKNNHRSAALLQAIKVTQAWIEDRTNAMLTNMGVMEANNLGRDVLLLERINTNDRKNKERADAIIRGQSIANQYNHQRTMATIGAVSQVDRKVSMNFAALLQIFQIVSESYHSVETSRVLMNEEFDRVLSYSKKSKIESTISKLKNFIEYYESERQHISELPREQRVTALKDERGLLHNLRESRTPHGDSLQTFMFEVMDLGYAIPTDQNDTVAMSALSALFYGCRTQVSVMYYLIQQYIYLADCSYRDRNFDEYNSYIDIITTIFDGFRHSLIGSLRTVGLIDRIMGIIKRIASLQFILVQRKAYAHLMELVRLLSRQKSKLLEASLPLVLEVPPKLTAQIKFTDRSPSTPLGPWEKGAKVSYAVQYRNKDNWYSKIGEWSTPLKIHSKSNPTLTVPANSKYTRLLFRKFNDYDPEFVGVLEHSSQIDFIDIDRDLYNTASSSVEDEAIVEASKLLSRGANISSVFDFGRGFLHAAAIMNNVNLVQAAFTSVKQIIDINAVDDNGYTPLQLAAEHGSVGFIELLLQNGADVNARNLLGSTALHVASATGYTNAVEALAKSTEVNINAQDNTGATPLHRAILSGVLENVKVLLSNPLIDQNIRSAGGLSPLHLAALVKFPEVTAMLIESYPTNLNCRSDGDLTTLHLAAITGNIQALRLLSGLDATDMNPQSVNGWTPLHYAVSLQKELVVSELLKYSTVIVDVPGKGRITPLHLAATTGKGTIIVDLIAHGADLELPTVDGMTAYHLAAINNNHEAMAILAISGANINARTVNGSTALHLVAANGHVQSVAAILEMGNSRLDIRDDDNKTPAQLAKKNGHHHILAMLRIKGGDESDVGETETERPTTDPPTPISTTMTPLLETNWIRYEQDKVAYHKAAERGLLTEVKNILARGMDVDSRDNNGFTALHKAAGNGHVAMVESLIKAGASSKTRCNNGLTPLVHAIFADQNEVASKLLELGAAVGGTSSNFYGMEAFHAAVLRNNTDLLKILSDHGANVNARLAEGNTALHLAAKQGSVPTVNFLLKIVHVNEKNDDGETPLQIAKKHSHDEVAQLIDSKIRSLNHHLVVLSKKGSLGHVIRLAASGGDLKTTSPRDKNATLCLLAAQGGHYDLVKFLIENGCDVNSENQDGERILHSANHLIAIYADMCGANPNPRTNSGNTPLHHAAARGDVATVGVLVKLLERHNEKMDVKNDDGQTPLSFALSKAAPVARKHLLNAVKHLVIGGANVNSLDINGRTPLIHASYAGLTDVVEYLVNHDANTDAAGKDGKTALDEASDRGHYEIAQLLLRKGAVVRRSFAEPDRNDGKDVIKEDSEESGDSEEPEDSSSEDD